MGQTLSGAGVCPKLQSPAPWGPHRWLQDPERNTALHVSLTHALRFLRFIFFPDESMILEPSIAISGPRAGDIDWLPKLNDRENKWISFADFEREKLGKIGNSLFIQPCRRGFNL